MALAFSNDMVNVGYDGTQPMPTSTDARGSGGKNGTAGNDIGLFDYGSLELDTEAQRGPSEAVMDGGDVEPSAGADVNRHAHLDAWFAPMLLMLVLALVFFVAQAVIGYYARRRARMRKERELHQALQRVHAADAVRTALDEKWAKVLGGEGDDDDGDGAKPATACRSLRRLRTQTLEKKAGKKLKAEGVTRENC